MSVLDVSRLQFALTAIFHFLFVVLTLGLAPVVAFFQTRWAVTGREVHERLTRYWGQLYVVNYAMGIVVGLAMEFQFGLHWSGLMTFAGDVFGAPLATETLVAFFLESTFLGMWIFGWHRLNRWVHTALIWLVVLTAYLSAYWVMVANGFLQDPVGHVVEDGVARIDDVGALLTNHQAVGALLHIVPVCLLTGSIVMVGICSWHFLRGTASHVQTSGHAKIANSLRAASTRTEDSGGPSAPRRPSVLHDPPDVDFFRRSLRVAVVVGAVAAVFAVGNGYAQFGYLTEGKELALGGSAAERAEFQAEMKRLHGPGDWTPPTWISFAWPLMEISGTLYMLIFFGLVFFLIKNAFDRARPAVLRRFWHRFYVWTLPWPFVVVACGWLIREVGRQPWVVYGELTTAEAVSSHAAGTVLTSLIVFGVLFATLAVLDWWLIARLARRGPYDLVLGSDGAAREEPEPELVLVGKD
ncbi:cytochrome ubiquinol oxidase subunit I [Jiangella rhizosphaerae]|uniref:Cytochrome ubiquinol oxidase subunit I n=1 Tax=Jiangella rhizosphaerae TaxID=2293569 RepID=A0A418KIQ9_9ACTN|nr:cytochrome ubiquinol oxidase subunit I [Jiangella rhizosphaerae]RIQ13615.1 cytochrome ubiquinol oxidase subunit I [Jiangella rhizosphaerae]